MKEIGQYLEILKESLEKKKGILEAVLEKNEEQAQAVKEDKNQEIFGRIVEEKAGLIEELGRLDDGFEQLYNRIREELVPNKERFRKEIAILQKLISQVTDLSVRIQASEKRNRKLAEDYFFRERDRLQKSHKSVKAASDYYRAMSRVNYVDPQLMDKKK